MTLRASLLFILALVISAGVPAQTHRAVIVGIDEYLVPGGEAVARGEGRDPRVWRNLNGAVNDAQRIKRILMARFGFDEKNIVFLENQQATRSAILEAIDRHLVDPDATTPSDVALFYFAGHGSRVRNSLSQENDKLDESLVPADAALGASDIRDKELRDRFNAVMEQGDSLVAIFDSCHSGSITRGAAGAPTDSVRMLPIDPRDVRDASQAPSPWEQGALLVSAAQQDQLAHEGSDEYGIKGGVFTISLARALQSASPSEPSRNLFRRVKALMKAEGQAQEPVLEGTNERKQRAFFGAATEGMSGRTVASVQSVEGGDILLQEGVAAGLTEQTELVKVGADTPRIRVVEVAGLVKSYAERLDGSPADIKVGDLFVVDKWAPPDVPALRVWMPTSARSAQALARFAGEVAALAEQHGMTTTVDPTEGVPTHTIFYDGANWQLTLPTGEAVSLGPDPTPRQLERQFRALPAERKRLFVSLPATSTLHGALSLGRGTHNSAVEPTSERSSAHYHLMGRMTDGRIDYAWVRPWLVDDAETSLPVRTDWVRLSDPVINATQSLDRFAVRLGRVRAWLVLEGPPSDGAFPYDLALKQSDSAQFVQGGTVFGGDSYELALVRNAEPMRSGGSRYVYVFAIDSKGQSTLLFPREAAVENRFPPEHDPLGRERAQVLRDSRFRVTEPFGIDTFIMIVTDEQLPDPTVLNSGGVRTRGPTPRGTTLQDLLANVGSRTRGVGLEPVSTEWSIQRLSIASRVRP